MKDNSGLWTSAVTFLVGLAVCFLIVAGTNSCSADKWDDGICPKCNIEYELKGVGNMLKYYQCPKCGEEVKRY